MPPPAAGPGRPITRRSLLRAAIAGAGTVALGGSGYGASNLIGRNDHARFLASWRSSDGSDGAARRFYSEPDVQPPTTRVAVSGDLRPSPGYLFVGPAAGSGAESVAMIVDNDGEPIWFQRPGRADWLTNFCVQSYRGAPVLTWWEGDVISGYGRGEAVISDASYREIARVRAANGRQMDMHELQLTDSGTALFTCAPSTAHADLRASGGSARGQVQESIFQEVDIATGRLVSEWRSLPHIEPAESYMEPAEPFDYLHLNSIDVTPDGNLLVSGRHTWALYKLERSSGAVMWRMGGRRNQFTMGPNSQFAWQHDGRQLDGGTLTVFDDGDNGVTVTHPSRGLLLSLDEGKRQVDLTQAYTHRHPLQTMAMGSARRLADGHMVVGWGNQPYTTEFDASGAVVADLQIGTSSAQNSYRGFRGAWTARPQAGPAVAVSRDPSSARATVYVSWNGATDVARWRIDGGGRRELRTLGTVPRRGFETAINLGREQGHVAVTALDHRGRELARSSVVSV